MKLNKNIPIEITHDGTTYAMGGVEITEEAVAALRAKGYLVKQLGQKPTDHRAKQRFSVIKDGQPVPATEQEFQAYLRSLDTGPEGTGIKLS